MMYQQTSLEELWQAPLEEPAGFWDDAEVISRYPRAQAIEDGELADVSELAREAGFIYPVAITAAVHADLENIPPTRKGIESYEGRLWDLLYLAFVRIRAERSQVTRDTLYAKMHLTRLEDTPAKRNAFKKVYIYKIHVGPGDSGEGVVTIMQRGED